MRTCAIALLLAPSSKAQYQNYQFPVQGYQQPAQVVPYIPQPLPYQQNIIQPPQQYSGQQNICPANYPVENIPSNEDQQYQAVKEDKRSKKKQIKDQVEQSESQGNSLNIWDSAKELNDSIQDRIRKLHQSNYQSDCKENVQSEPETQIRSVPQIKQKQIVNIQKKKQFQQSDQQQYQNQFINPGLSIPIENQEVKENDQSQTQQEQTQNQFENGSDQSQIQSFQNDDQNKSSCKQLFEECLKRKQQVKKLQRDIKELKQRSRLQLKTQNDNLTPSNIPKQISDSFQPQQESLKQVENIKTGQTVKEQKPTNLFNDLQMNFSGFNKVEQDAEQQPVQKNIQQIQKDDQYNENKICNYQQQDNQETQIQKKEQSVPQIKNEIYYSKKVEQQPIKVYQQQPVLQKQSEQDLKAPNYKDMMSRFDRLQNKYQESDYFKKAKIDQDLKNQLPQKSFNQQASQQENNAGEENCEKKDQIEIKLLSDGECEETVPPGSTVTVDYVGKIKVKRQGKLQYIVFDSSYARRQPFTFTLGQNQVIQGWEQAISQMKKGQKAEVIIPPSLGYGDQGVKGKIPPGATLYFTIELKNWQ